MKSVSGFRPLDAEAAKRMAVLAGASEESIDTEDIPEWTKEDFSSALPFNSVWKPRNEQITARIDVDIIVWLKSHGKGYQTLMNDLLRKEILEERQKLA